MTDDEREAELRRQQNLNPKDDPESNIDFLLRRLDEARRPPTLAEIREMYIRALLERGPSVSPLENEEWSAAVRSATIDWSAEERALPIPEEP